MKRFPRFKSVVINVRGSNGSGKSTIVRRFLKGRPYKPLYGRLPGKPDKIWGYKIAGALGENLEELTLPTYIVGPYETPTGGCDPLPDFDFICSAIVVLSRYGHVLFEGALVSTLVGRFTKLQADIKDHAHCIFGVLDTPEEKCIKRVNKRRAARGKEPIDPKRSMKDKFRAVQTSAATLKREGMDVRPLKHKKAFKTMKKWLQEEH